MADGEANGMGEEMNINDLKKIAEKELSEEYAREEIEKIKLKLRNKKPIWEKLFPFKIVIIRR